MGLLYQSYMEAHRVRRWSADIDGLEANTSCYDGGQVLAFVAIDYATRICRFILTIVPPRRPGQR
jgi:hypothetical protein